MSDTQATDLTTFDGKRVRFVYPRPHGRQIPQIEHARIINEALTAKVKLLEAEVAELKAKLNRG